MSLESYQSGIEDLLKRQDLTEKIRSELEEVLVLLVQSSFTAQGVGGRSRIISRLRSSVNNLINRRNLTDPPLPELRLSLGSARLPSPSDNKPR